MHRRPGQDRGLGPHSWLTDFGSYAEVSPSGRGVKIFVEGAWLGGKSYEMLDGLGEDGRGQIEIAKADRFFTVTGDRVDENWSCLTPGAGQLDGLHAYMEKEREKRTGVAVHLKRDDHRARGPRPREELVGLSPLDKFCAQLDAMGNRYRPCGQGFTACCPVHRESNPSMTFRVEDGQLLIHCHGCQARFDVIMAAMGLRPKDAFPECDPDGFVLPDRPQPTGRQFRPAEFGIPRELVAQMTARTEHFQRRCRIIRTN